MIYTLFETLLGTEGLLGSMLGSEQLSAFLHLLACFSLACKTSNGLKWHQSCYGNS